VGATAKKTLKMAKKKKQTYNISDFFGAYNTYRIFALQSELPTFMFANQLGQAAQTAFTMLPGFEYNSDRFSALFSVFYAVYSQQESIHCLLLENKAAISNQNEIFVSKAEQNLSFQTLSLFDEYLYLFNRQGLRCFDMKFDDMDYLLLLFAKKEIDKEMFAQFFKSIEPFKVQDVSYLLKKEQTSAEAKIVAFLRDLYCKYEVKANQFSRRKERDLLAPVKQIPAQNLQFPIPARLEYNAVADYLQISEEYLAQLREEV
jgi:hypothetical protein